MAYRKSIEQAITAANVKLTVDEQIPHWTPYQLRHARATELVKTHGLDVARAVLGQKSLSVTQIYNHADTQISIAVAKEQNKLKTAPGVNLQQPSVQDQSKVIRLLTEQAEQNKLLAQQNAVLTAALLKAGIINLNFNQ